MTNFEKYKEEILSFIEICGSTPGRIDGTFVPCNRSSCEDCEYDSIESCVATFMKWLYEDDGEEHDRCDGCKYEYKREDKSPCTECCNNYMSKWERRPKKTRQDEFLEMFPNARLNSKGILDIQPCNIDTSYSTDRCYFACGDECQNTYWSQEVEK